MMLAEKEAVVGAEQEGGLVCDALAVEFLPNRAHVAVIVLDADIVVLDQFFERSRIVAENLGVADLVVGVGYGARLSGPSVAVLIEGGRRGDGHAIQIVDHVFGTVERRVRRIEPEKQAKWLGPLLLEPLSGLAREQRIHVFAFVELRRLILAANV